jgi:hypothetical protein
MDNNIIKINLVEVADRLATKDLLYRHEVDDEMELMVQTGEIDTFVWRDDIQDEYNELYDYYYTLLSELEVVEV